MNKMQWFENFERLQAEHPQLSDDTLSEMARDQQVDQDAARADQLHDEAKHEILGPTREKA